MNKSIREFIEYKKICPLCGKNLYLSFKGKNNYKVKYEENNVVFKKDMYTLSKKRHYSFFFSIDMDENTFFIDFCNSRGDIFNDYVPVSYIKEFIKYNNQCNMYNNGALYKHCTNCNCYGYNTNFFKINMKQSKLEDLYIADEYISIHKVINEDTCRVVRLYNQYDKKISIVDWFNTNDLDLRKRSRIEWNFIYYDNDNMLKLPLQEINDIDSVVDRVDKLLIFS